MLDKCSEGGDLQIALLNYRSMPVAGTDLSLSEMLYSRRLRTGVPVHKSKQKPIVHEDVEKNIQNYSERHVQNNGMILMQKKGRVFPRGECTSNSK